MDDAPSPKREELVTMEEDEDAGVPDPDEPLGLLTQKSPAWLVKLPKDLLQKWSQYDEDGVHLATIRVYKKDQKMTVVLPKSTPTARAEKYNMEMVRTIPRHLQSNVMVVAERPKGGPPETTRIRETILTGHLEYECNLKPILDSDYQAKIRKRTVEANTRDRQILMLDHQEDRAQLNQMGGGAATGFFTNVSRAKPRNPKSEKFTRIAKNELLDQLFDLFREDPASMASKGSQPYWKISDLRQRTQQPEQYLKETLQEIAVLHRSGEHSGKWGLQEAFKGANGSAMAGVAVGGVKLEAGGVGRVKSEPGSMYSSGMEEDEDDDEEDYEMEEVS